MFLVCEPGQRVTDAFARFNGEIDKCDWHLLPANKRRLYLIFSLDTQQPNNIRCYGRILSTRHTFKEVHCKMTSHCGPNLKLESSMLFIYQFISDNLHRIFILYGTSLNGASIDALLLKLINILFDLFTHKMNLYFYAPKNTCI